MSLWGGHTDDVVITAMVILMVLSFIAGGVLLYLILSDNPACRI